MTARCRHGPHRAVLRLVVSLSIPIALTLSTVWFASTPASAMRIGGGGGSQNYKLTFSESGLPSTGSPPTNPQWTASVNCPSGTNVTNSSSGDTIGFSLATGFIYCYSIANVSFNGLIYTPSPAMGNVTVSGANVVVDITFNPLYNVTFEEAGLPSGINWSVQFWNNTTLSSWSDSANTSASNTSIGFMVPNGSYDYLVENVSTYVPASSVGNFSVTDANVTVRVTFTFESGGLNQLPFGGLSGKSTIQLQTQPTWGGYAACSNSVDACTSDVLCSSGTCIPTSTSIIGVSGTFQIPAVVNTSTSKKSYPEAVSEWVGIGGLGTQDLIQAGISEFFTSGQSLNIETFYEMGPGLNAVDVPFNPHVGDWVNVEITYDELNSGGDQQWSFSITDLTDTSSWSGTETCSSGCVPSNFESAEWIVECPEEGSTITEFPAYAPVEFYNDEMETGNGGWTWLDSTSLEQSGNLNALYQSYSLAHEKYGAPLYFPQSGAVPSGILQSGCLPASVSPSFCFWVQYLLGTFGSLAGYKFVPNPDYVLDSIDGNYATGTYHTYNPSAYAININKKKDLGVGGPNPLRLTLEIQILSESGTALCSNYNFAPNNRVVGVAGSVSALVEISLKDAPSVTGCTGLTSGDTYAANFSLWWVGGSGSTLGGPEAGSLNQLIAYSVFYSAFTVYAKST